MMVFEQTSVAMNNKSVLTVSPTQTKLDTGVSSIKSNKTLTKRVSSSSSKKRTSLTKSVSESHKKSVAKEPKSSKSELSKTGSKDKKEKKEKKKRKEKRSSDSSLRNKEDSDANASTEKNTLPLHSHAPPARASSEHTGKMKAKQRSLAKKMKSESMMVAELIQNHQSLGTSEHTTDTVSTTGSVDNEDSTSTYKKSSSKKKGKRTSESKKSKGAADKSSSEEEDSVALTISPEATNKKPCAPKSRRPGLTTFESIHGKSIHKPQLRRGSMTNTSTDITEIRNGNKVPMSPTATFGNLSSPPSSGTKRASVLKLKKEKQMQEQAEKEKKELKSRLARSMVQKKKEDYIHEVLDIVHSNDDPKDKAVADRSKFLANTRTEDPDECSSQSSSCSVVSDGSYEKDDLLSHTSEHSDDRNTAIETPDNFNPGENPSFEEEAFAMEIESPKKASYSDRSHASPSEESFTETLSNKDGLKDSLIGVMAASMGALHEVEDEDDNSPKRPPKSVLKKTALKMAASVGKPPLRLVPKRTQSDVTSLKTMTNNIVRVRLPGRRKSISRQRSLTFNEKVRVKRIPCQAQVAEGDVADLWFQPQEYEAIKRKTMALIRAVQDDATGGVTYCTRGLERYFSVDDVSEKRNEAWDSVLDEQEAQRVNREAFNADRMAQLYVKTTRLSSQEAMERGKLDEDAIARYTKKMRQTLRRTYSMPV